MHFTELEAWIQADISAFQGRLPERYAIAWHGYLAALVEWQMIAMPLHSKLSNLLPKVSDPNPIMTIFSGRD
jgi:hypothetical protein